MLDLVTPHEESFNEIDNKGMLNQNNNALSSRTSMPTIPSCSKQCSTASTKDVKEIGSFNINKSIHIKPIIQFVKVTRPTNADVNDHKRQFTWKQDCIKDDIFAPKKKI